MLNAETKYINQWIHKVANTHTIQMQSKYPFSLRRPPSARHKKKNYHDKNMEIINFLFLRVFFYGGLTPSPSIKTE